MFAYIRRSKLFLHVEAVQGVKDAAGNDVTAGKELRFLAPKSDDAQQLPEWVRSTMTWKVGVKEGSIVEVVAPPAAPVVQEPAPAVADDKKAPADDDKKSDATGDKTAKADKTKVN